MTWQELERASLVEVARAAELRAQLEGGSDRAWEHARTLAELRSRGDEEARRAVRLLRWSGYRGALDWLAK